jgi:hypothetical protein
MDQFKLFSNNKLSRNFTMKDEGKSEFFHTSSYAKEESGDNIGVAGASAQSFELRQQIEKQRKLVKGYNNSRIIGNIYAQKRASTMTPRTEGGTGSLYGGNVRSSFGKSEGNGPDHSGYGRREGSKPEHSNFGRVGGEFSNTDAKAKDFSGVAGRAGRVYGSGGSSGPKSMPAAKPRPVKLPWK